jgi:hypothetical protein
MGKKHQKMAKGAPYKGFRLGIQPKRKVNFPAWEKCETLTSLQHEIVQEHLDRAIKLGQVDTGKLDEQEQPIMEETVVYMADPWYIARLFALLEKPFIEATVDHLGNPWSKPEPVEPLTEEEIAEINKKAVADKNKEVVIEDEEVAKKIKGKK